MGEEGGLVVGFELVVEGDEDGAAVEGGVGADEPAGLVAHEDGDAVAGADAGVLEVARDAHRLVAEVAVRVGRLLLLAARLDQRDLALEGEERVGQELAETGVALRRDHLAHSRLPMSSARPPKVLTPWTS